MSIRIVRDRVSTFGLGLTKSGNTRFIEIGHPMPDKKQKAAVEVRK